MTNYLLFTLIALYFFFIHQRSLNSFCCANYTIITENLQAIASHNCVFDTNIKSLGALDVQKNPD